MPYVLLVGALAAGLYAWWQGPLLLRPGTHTFRFKNGSTDANKLSLTTLFGGSNVHDLGGGLYSVSVLAQLEVRPETLGGATFIS